MIRFCLLLLIGGLAGCGGSATPRLPHAMEQAQGADKDARRALRNGELLRAQHNFLELLALQESLDDRAAAATTLINLATVAHQLNDDSGALVWLDKILLEKNAIYPPEARLVAAFRKAVILTAMGRLNEATTALQLAETLCAQKCAERYGMAVLRARLALLQGNASYALAAAQALGRQEVIGREEQANAWRVAAAAAESLSRPEEALQYFQAALEIDRSLGLSTRIAEDLNGLARVNRSLGHTEEAAAYTRRAELVSDAERKRKGAAR